MKRKHRIGIASISIAIIVSFTLGIFIFNSKGINLLASIEETRYIYLSSKRDTVVYDLYKQISEFQFDIETLSDINIYTDRANKAREYKTRSEEFSNELTNLLENYDLKLLNYEVNNELANLAKNYYTSDALLLDQQNSITEYLEIEYQLNNYLLAKSEIIDCYTNINITIDSSAIKTSFTQCLDRAELVKLPTATTLSESIKYENLLSNYLNKNIDLYKALEQDDIAKANSLKSEVKSLYKQIQSQNSIANNQIINVLTKVYFDINDAE